MDLMIVISACSTTTCVQWRATVLIYLLVTQSMRSKHHGISDGLLGPWVPDPNTKLGGLIREGCCGHTFGLGALKRITRVYDGASGGNKVVTASHRCSTLGIEPACSVSSLDQDVLSSLISTEQFYVKT